MSCDLYSACASIPLGPAPCCPTVDGWQLDCCTNSTTVLESCVDNPACAAKGLQGSCCPTIDGVFLDCCTEVPDECYAEDSCVPAPVEATCEYNQFCDELGLEGLCCPTRDGLNLDCCGTPVQRQCQDNPSCAALGLTG